MRYLLHENQQNKFDLSQYLVTNEIEKQIALKAGCIEVSDEDYAKLERQELCWKNGILVPYVKTQSEIEEEKRIIALVQVIAIKENRIQELKRLLASWDYKTSKHADGDYTEAQWADIVAQRTEWRTEIKRLETELEKLKKT